MSDEKVKDSVILLDQPPAETNQETKAKFSARFDDDFFLRIECDLKAAVESEDLRLLLRGFLAEKVDEAMAFINIQRQKAAFQKQQLVKVQNKNGFRNFLNKIVH